MVNTSSPASAKVSSPPYYPQGAHCLHYPRTPTHPGRRTFFGALGQAFTADRFGRKHSIVFWSTIFTIGTAIQTGTETSIAQISAGRFIAGLGVGAMSAIVPLYNGETAPKAMRGVLLVMYQMQVIMGCVTLLQTQPPTGY